MVEARRYNKGKIRFELISKLATLEKAKVYTLGAHKYTLYKDSDGNVIKGADITLEDACKYDIIADGSNNWKDGLRFTEVLESLRRHIEAFSKGEDYDPDLKTYHLANAAWNIDVLLEQYTTHPELDDRRNTYFNKRVALDIDGVIADFEGAFCERFGLQSRNNHWHFTYEWKRHRDELKNDKDFWLNMKPLVDGSKLPFEPCAYVTNRQIPVEWIEEWLESNGFPCEPVYSTSDKKVEVLKNIGVDLFVEDCYSNFVELNNSGVFCYLIDRPYNSKFNVGHRRIYSLDEIVKR